MIELENAVVYHGSNLDVLPTLPDNSVDAIVTDPPYELGFMGKSWDSSGIAYSVELWQECLRVLKPGGHLLAFGGSRTWHRIAVAIEDAGFDVRDSIAWLYGSGFPKSLDISKAIDKKPESSSTKRFKTWLGKQIEKSSKLRKEIDDECGFTACSYAKTDGKDYWSTNHPSADKWAKMKEVIGLSDEWDWVITDNLDQRGYIETTGGLHGGTGNTVGNFVGKQLSDNAVSDEAKKWQGWGTALKPAFEPIVVARKPLVGTVAANVLLWGVGGLNIDVSRIKANGENLNGGGKNHDDNLVYGSGLGTPSGRSMALDGRWPANIILDEYTAGLLDEQSGVSQPKPQRQPGVRGGKQHFDGGWNKDSIGTWPMDNGGGASRFFYVAKASKKDRNEGLENIEGQEVGAKGNGLGRTCATCGATVLDGCQCPDRTFVNPTRQNFHPTVKPTALMEYLVKLVTPPGGVVLDPFTGSGSTGKAALLNGFKFIGIELTADYLPIIKGRLEFAAHTFEQQAKEKETKESETLF